jgi:hypothetical protein
MRAYLLAWDGKHFLLSFIKESPMFVSFADLKEIDVPMINPRDSQKPFFIIFL